MDNYTAKNENLAAHALGALDASEARALAAQIAVDDELAAELAEWQTISAQLAFAAAPEAPAPRLRQQILTSIRETPQTKQSRLETSVVSDEKDKSKDFEDNIVPVAKPASPAVANHARPSRTPFSWWQLMPAFGAVAASVVAVLLGISLYSAAESNKLKNEQIAALNQKINDVQNQLEREREARELLASPATFVKALSGTKEIPAAKARLVFDPQTGKALLYVEGLPAPPPGKSYQIWFITDPKHPAPGRTFETDQTGRGVLRDQIPAQDLKAGTFAVTVEPPGGSPAPTSAPVLVSAI